MSSLSICLVLGNWVSGRSEGRSARAEAKPAPSLSDDRRITRLSVGPSGTPYLTAPLLSRTAAAWLAEPPVSPQEEGTELVPPTELIPPSPAGAPKWAVDIYREVTAQHLGDSFNVLLRLWSELEGM
ncbi:hypothetical protein C8R45DRAFT_1097569 [Mycena sanguinolenta]|nr:hypothetical protein C8R45DRAFT_1097569 [Mycena sanguinolenta]